MSVHISSVNIRKMGPLNGFQQELRAVNIFYGLNETGKTYLVEFLLRSLFRQASSWMLRKTAGDGSITISGLEKEPVLFQPDGGKKLEDYWKEEESGLPQNMARLLVVKGAQLALAGDSPGGVNREVLKTALTSQALLDEIWDSIQGTIRKASLEEGRILGNNMGKIKDLNQLRSDLAEIETLLERIEERYSRGPSRQIEIALEELERKISEQQRAKQHLAYILSAALLEHKNALKSPSKEKIEEQRDRIRDFQRKEEDLTSLQDRLSRLQKKSKDFHWLDAAVDTWKEQKLDDKEAPPIFLGGAGLAFLLGGVILLALASYLPNGSLFWAGLGLSASGLLIGGFYAFRHLRWIQQLDDSRERKLIQEGFQSRFGFLPKSLTDLQVQRDEIKEDHIAAKTTGKLIDEKVQELELERSQIINGYQGLLGRKVDKEGWQEQIELLVKEHADHIAAAADLEIQLSRLGVPEDQYREEAPGADFSPAALEDLLRAKNELSAELREKNDALEILKARACERTGDEITEAWPTIYHHLQVLAAEMAAEGKRLTAEIIAKIGLTSVLENIKAQEDQKIIRALNADEVSLLIEKMTGKYKGIDLENEQLYLHDRYSRFALQDLSTGAQDQIQLALRLGIATRISGGSPMFVILDDAFQHSDWERREALVASTLELAAQGWQINYMTMDDHIRDLYTRQAAPILKDEFQLIYMEN